MSRDAFPKIDYEHRQHEDYFETRRRELEDAERELRESIDRSMEELKATALRVKAERDEAIFLLQRTLDLREMGSQGPHKSDIRAFLQRIGEAP